MTRTSRWTLRAATTAAARFSFARPASAQRSGSFTTAQVDKNGSSACAYSPFGDAPVNARCIVEATGATVTTYGDVLATVDAANKLHAKAVLHTDRPYYSYGGDVYDASTRASMWDELTFDGDVVPTSLRVRVNMDGSETNSDYHWGTGHLAGWFNSSEPAFGLDLDDRELLTGVQQTLSTTFTVPLIGSTMDLALELTASAHLREVPWDGGATLPLCVLRGEWCGMEARADLANTAWIDLIEGLDADGNVIASGMKVRSASGAGYTVSGGVMVTATPEPTAIGLLTLGLGALGVVVRRRRLAA